RRSPTGAREGPDPSSFIRRACSKPSVSLPLFGVHVERIPAPSLLTCRYAMSKSSTLLDKRLAAYAAAAGVAIAAAPSSDAQTIVYEDLDPDVCVSFGNAFFDFDGDAVDDSRVRHYSYGAYGIYGDVSFAPGGGFVAASASGLYARALGSADPISAGQMFGNG